MTRLITIVLVFALGIAACAYPAEPMPTYEPEPEPESEPEPAPEQPAPMESTFIVALAYITTLQGLQAAASGAAGTFVLSDGKFLLFVWEQSGYPAFALLNMATAKPVEEFLLNASGNGALTDYKSMGEVVNYVRSLGWIDVPKGQVPKFIVEALASNASWMALTSMDYLPTFILMPSDMDPMNLFPEPIEG